jgi:xanthine dehydrogenase accessory factor
MREIAQDLRRWWEAGIPFALATVTDVRRSTPRQPGAAMAVAETGEVSGSVSGGCVEGAVVEVGQGVLASGRATAVSYGYSDEEAFAVGLTCGGELDLVVRRVDPDGLPFFADLLASIERHEPVAVVTVIDGQALGASLMVTPLSVAGSLGAEGLDAAVTDDARGMLAQGTTGQRRYGPAGERRLDDVGVFVASFVPPPRMLVFGAIDYAAAVARIGKFLGYQVTVCDARKVFATARRFPDADEVVVEWPHRYLQRTTVDERTVICVLTHDPKFDVPLLEVALGTPASYIGAMGSRRTHDDRLARLRAAGVTEEGLARVHSPIGLDLGARTPEETAVSIAAEIIQRRWGGSGLPLRATGGRIHSEAAEPVVRA